MLAIASGDRELSLSHRKQLQSRSSFPQMRKPARCNRALPGCDSASLFFLHYEHEGADEGGGQEKPDALQRPHITRH